MEINLTNRLILIVGPSTTGKPNLAKKIKREAPANAVIISHDEVLRKINRKQSQAQIDLEFRLALIQQIFNAVNDLSNEYIILDTLNFNFQALFALLSIIRMGIKYTDGITLIKMNPSLELHKRFILSRAKKDKLVDSSTILSQRSYYMSNKGSLYASTNLADEEIIIENPNDITLSFGKTKKFK